MAQRITASVLKLGRAHFPEAIEIKIGPPPGKLEEVMKSAKKTLTYQEIQMFVEQAQVMGFGRGAIVVRPATHYISADVWNWGIVTGHNYGTPSPNKEWEGPLTVAWPLKNGSEKNETKHWPEDLYLYRAAPEKQEIAEATDEMKIQFAAGRRR